jgi:TolB-like protein
VLPFTNLGAPDDEYFADGVSDALRGSLAALGNIVVIASSSSRAYRDTDKPASQIGRELGAHYLLTGTVRWARGSDGASRVQVSPELIVAESGTTHWQQPFDAVLSDVFVVQGEIATRVADALAVTLLETQRRELAARPTHDLAAWDAYLRASALQQQADLGAPLQRLAAEGFQRAVISIRPLRWRGRRSHVRTWPPTGSRRITRMRARVSRMRARPPTAHWRCDPISSTRTSPTRTTGTGDSATTTGLTPRSSAPGDAIPTTRRCSTFCPLSCGGRVDSRRRPTCWCGSWSWIRSMPPTSGNSP